MPENTRALILFVKAPVAGQCKTRLAPALSPEESRDLYRAFCHDIFATVNTLSATDIWIAYQPHDEFPTPEWLTAGAPAPYAGSFLQEGAHLGERLARAFQTLFERGYSSICALGTDAPTLPRAFIEEAFAALERHAAVFGPAEDGGYYLVGLARFVPELFQNIAWSTDEVMAQTRRVARQLGLRTYYLSEHYDVDTPENLQRLAADVTEGPTVDFKSDAMRQVLSRLRLLI